MNFQEKLIQLTNGQLINYIQLNQTGQRDIIFVHGNMSAWVWWKDVLELIKSNQKYHVIALDMRGFGKSSYNHRVSRFTHQAQDILDFIKLKKLKNVVLIGWSYGGVISMKAAQLAPQLISKLILTASGSHLGLPLTNQKGQRVYTQEQIQSLPFIQARQIIRKQKNYEQLSKTFQTVLLTKIPNYPEQKKKQLIQCSFQQASLLDTIIASANSDIDIQKIKAKSLILHGRQDPVIKVQYISITGQLLGNCLEIWENHAHMLPIEDTQRFVTRITQFIDQ